jgi:hypothetical protein
MKYNKEYKDKHEDVTKENSFVYVQIKSTVKCIYTFDVWIAQSNIVKMLHILLIHYRDTVAKNTS